MSKAKPWPTVANHHRHQAIMKSGEITTATQEALDEVALLRRAVENNNVALALAISRTIEVQFKFIQEASQSVATILETAPSESENNSKGS